MRRLYIYESEDWPRFTWNAELLSGLLASVRNRQGRLIGHMEALGFAVRQEAVLETLTADVLKISNKSDPPSRVATHTPLCGGDW